MEFIIGGVAACGAGIFTNPLEVAKTRMQLQGELAAKGQYVVHYKNVLHAFYTIGKVDGLAALQKGLIPALWYQFFMNGVRLGAFQWFTNEGFINDSNGKVSLPRTVFAGAVSGCLGAFCASPLYMVKVQLQARAQDAIAVGHQHEHESMGEGLKIAYRQQGILGLWRGVTSSMPRVTVGSATQLTTFSWCKEKLVYFSVFPAGSLLNTLAASMSSGAATVLLMTPFDVVSTRVYNQPVDGSGKGVLYRSVTDCFIKTFKKEGLWGFYKGWGASLFRLGPHTVLSLVFWNRLQILYADLSAP